MPATSGRMLKGLVERNLCGAFHFCMKNKADIIVVTTFHFFILDGGGRNDHHVSSL
jgi:hypothetical protein